MQPSRTVVMFFAVVAAAFAGGVTGDAGAVAPNCVGNCSFPNGQSHLFVYPKGPGESWTDPAVHKNPNVLTDFYIGDAAGYEKNGWFQSGGATAEIYVANRKTAKGQTPGALTDVMLVVAIPPAVTSATLTSGTLSGGGGGGGEFPHPPVRHAGSPLSRHMTP